MLDIMKVDVNERAKLAREYFESGYNCAQSVFLAFRDITGLDKQMGGDVFRPLRWAAWGVCARCVVR